MLLAVACHSGCLVLVSWRQYEVMRRNGVIDNTAGCIEGINSLKRMGECRNSDCLVASNVTGVFVASST